MIDDEMRPLVDFILANDGLRKVMSDAIDALNEFMAEIAKTIPLDDLAFLAEREHHQRMLYTIYFMPARSNN